MRTAKTACTARIPASPKNGSAGGQFRIFAPISASGVRCASTSVREKPYRVCHRGKPGRIRRIGAQAASMPEWRDSRFGGSLPSRHGKNSTSIASIHVTCLTSDRPAFLPDEVAVEPGSDFNSIDRSAVLQFRPLAWNSSAESDDLARSRSERRERTPFVDAPIRDRTGSVLRFAQRGSSYAHRRDDSCSAHCYGPQCHRRHVSPWLGAHANHILDISAACHRGGRRPACCSQRAFRSDDVLVCQSHGTIVRATEDSAE